MKIGVDLMGSDASPNTLFKAVLEARNQLGPSGTLVVIATHSVVNDLRRSHTELNGIEFHSVSDAIAMADEPMIAVSRKRESSLVVGIRLLRKRKLDAFVSAGNTGALIGSAALQLPKLPGVQRPGFLAVLPTLTGSVVVLDVGGSVMCKAHHLVQFAYLGAAFQMCSRGISQPKVGLLNIGIEPKKGSSAVRQAYQVLQEQSPSFLHFLGNVEGRELFKGGIDVLVTDGFTGNVLLKTSEGISSFIFEYIQESLQAPSSPEFQQRFLELKRYFSYAEYPGAILCGVEGVVVKCHGNASTKAMLSSIKGAANIVNQQLIPKLKACLESR